MKKDMGKGFNPKRLNMNQGRLWILPVLVLINAGLSAQATTDIEQSAAQGLKQGVNTVQQDIQQADMGPPIPYQASESSVSSVPTIPPSSRFSSFASHQSQEAMAAMAISTPSNPGEYSSNPAAGPVQISVLPTEAPYQVSQDFSRVRQQASSVASYIQSRNSRLSMDDISPISLAIVQYSYRYGVDYRLLTSVIAIESSFRHDAVSSSGAIGMGQLKPDTARWLGVIDPYNPIDNIAGTARFLSWLVQRYNGNLKLALAAYYQGPGTVDHSGITPVCVPYLERVNQALGPLL